MTTYITPEALATELKGLRETLETKITGLDEKLLTKIDLRFELLERTIGKEKEISEIRLREAEKAVDLASKIMDAKLDGFPDLFMKRHEYNSAHEKLLGEVKLLMEQMAKTAGKEATEGRQVSLWISIGALLISGVGVLFLLLRHLQTS